MIGTLVGVGIAIEFTARRAVAIGRVNTWVGMSAAFALLSAGSLLTGEVHLSAEPVGTAIGVALVVAVLFFVATRLFLKIASRWGRFLRDEARLFQVRDNYPVRLEVALGAAVACGEEIFWRGLVLPWAQARSGSTAAGALLALGGYVAVSVAATSVPVVLGALVGGAVWTALAVWSGGVLAGMICHGTWTALMIAFPPAEVPSTT